MTYAKNNTIQATDFNTFAGVTSVASPNSTTATNKAAYLWGIGFADRGYGQATYPTTNVAAPQSIAAEWRNLQSTLTALASWQGSSTSYIPPASAFTVGSPIVAHRTVDGNAYDIAAALALVDTNRLNYQIGNMTLVSNVASSTQPNQWGNTTGATITAEFTCVFNNEDDARYFFNTGGQIRIALDHPNTSSAQNISWHDALLGLNIGFGSHSTSRLSGVTGTGSSIGFFELTTAYQRIYNATNFLSGVYTQNDYYIDVKSTSIPGVNGGKGNTLIFKITLVDEGGSSYGDIVDAGTVATVSYLKATSGISIINPSITKTLGFSGLSYPLSPINYLLVAGGGSGGAGVNDSSGGGGAGGGGGGVTYGVWTGDLSTFSATVTIGAGGAGVGSLGAFGTMGTASSMSGTISTTTGAGWGGAAATGNWNPSSTGKGGDGGGPNGATGGGASQPGGSNGIGAGGGGGSADNAGGREGGNGYQWTFNGAYYSGGGGGGGDYGGAGGAGGGGAGGSVAGSANTGGGGGGGNEGAGSGSGGSGVAIFTYTSPTQVFNGGAITTSGSGVSTRWFHTFTSSGSLTHV